MTRKTRRTLLKTLGAAGAVGLAGCLGDDDDAAGGTIELGLLMGTTGVLEALGPPIRDGAEAATQQINDADIDWEVETAFEETDTDTETGIDGAQSLVDRGFPMFVGALLSDVSLAVARDVTLEEGIIQMSPASTAVEYSDLDADIDGNLTWRTTPSDAFQGTVAANIAREDIGAESVSTLAVDDPYGRGLAGEFADAFTEQGGDVQEELLLDGDQDTYTSQLEDALSDDPELLYIVAFPEQGQNIFRDFYEGFDRPELPILVPDGLQDPTLPDSAGQDVETFANVTGTGPGVSDDVASGLETYQELVDEDFVFVREAYDAAAVLSLAYAAADGEDPNSIRAAIPDVANPNGGETITADTLPEGIELAASGEDITYDGVSRPIQFDDRGDVDTPVYEYFGWTRDDDGEAVLDSIRIISG